MSIQSTVQNAAGPLLIGPRAGAAGAVIPGIGPRLRKNSGAAGVLRYGSLGALIFGPLLGLLYIMFMPFIFILLGFLMLPGILLAKTEAVTLEGKSAVCMGCHAAEGMTKTFASKETISLQVDARQLTQSAHSFLECTDCHQSIAASDHPAGSVYRSKKEFEEKMSAACRTCHSDQALKKQPMHFQAATRANAPPCTECHSGHAVKNIASVKKAQSDNQYCLTCHQKELAITSTNAVTSISEQQLKRSVHSNHRCADCHAGFSKEQHPIKKYGHVREHVIALSATCERCHADKLVQVNGSIHASMLKQNRNAPVCTDCHGFHDVTPKAAYATVSGVPCKKCHEDVFAEYAKSVHGRAKISGSGKHAPLCSSCHRAHDIKATALNSAIKDACLGCHANAPALHERWLPNTALHLDSIACAVCHSPEADRGVSLTLIDRNTGKPITEEQLIAILGGNYRELITLASSRSSVIDDRGLQNIVNLINDKSSTMRVSFRGAMAVTGGTKAHDLALKGKAVKECEQCHNADSPFFRNVTVAIGKSNGKMVRIEAQQEVLGSLFSVIPAGQFYVLGGTRLRMLDFVGILMVIGGATFPLAHLAIRALTAPIRKNRKEGRS
ncbi:MAG: multiheme c-type cytochrome [Nitrospirota bacterium]